MFRASHALLLLSAVFYHAASFEVEDAKTEGVELGPYSLLFTSVFIDVNVVKGNITVARLVNVSSRPRIRELNDRDKLLDPRTERHGFESFDLIISVPDLTDALKDEPVVRYFLEIEETLGLSEVVVLIFTKNIPTPSPSPSPSP